MKSPNSWITESLNIVERFDIEDNWCHEDRGQGKGRMRITAPWTGLGNKTHQKKWGFAKSGAGLSASRANIHRRRQDMTFSCCIYAVKQLLNNIQRQKRLAWAEDKKGSDCWREVQSYALC